MFPAQIALLLRGNRALCTLWRLLECSGHRCLVFLFLTWLNGSYDTEIERYSGWMRVCQCASKGIHGQRALLMRLCPLINILDIRAGYLAVLPFGFSRMVFGKYCLILYWRILCHRVQRKNYWACFLGSCIPTLSISCCMGLLASSLYPCAYAALATDRALALLVNGPWLPQYHLPFTFLNGISL